MWGGGAGSLLGIDESDWDGGLGHSLRAGHPNYSGG